MMDLTLAPTPLEDRTVGEVVAEDFRRGITFKQFGIDFCCGGGKTVGEACQQKGVSVDALRAALETGVSDSATRVPARAASWSPAFLADYIVNEHHSYVRDRIPVLKAFTKRVAAVHGHHYTELAEIRDTFHALADELEQHMAHEEEGLFPLIGQEGLAERIEQLEGDHEVAGSAMKRIRELSNEYTPPESACNTFRAAYAGLKDFEEDLHAHVHLENNILFPSLTATG